MVKKVIGTHLQFLEVGRVVFGIIFGFQGSVGNFADHSLILNKHRGHSPKCEDNLVFELF
jgi:hypothetical protein